MTMTTHQAAHVAVLEDLLAFDDRNVARGRDHYTPDVRAALTAAIELMKQAGWQPIETCPSDVDVLLYFPAVSETMKRRGKRATFKIDRYPGLTAREATHWQPLAAPEASR